MADVLELEVRVANLEASVRDMERLEGATRDVATAEGDARRGGEEMVRALQGGAQRVQGFASAIQSLVSAVGSHDRSAGLVASMAGAVSQGVAFGATFGPGGAVVGGAVAAASSLAGLAREGENARRTFENLNRDAVSALREISHAIASEDESSWSGAMASAREELDTLNARAAELRETAGSTLRGILDPLGVRAANAELAIVEENIANLTAAMGRLSDTAANAPALPGTGGAVGVGAALELDTGLARAGMRPERPTGGGGRSRRDELADIYAGWEDAEDAFYREREERLASFYDDIENESADAAAERIDAELSANEDGWNARLEQEREKQDQLAEIRREALDREMQDERDKQDFLHDQAEAAADAREQQIGQLMGYVGRSAKTIGTAIAEVAIGAKSGEEAFLGMLKSFLEMISEYASLKAATEFADAAASFARYDFGGGAAHVGAGLAFTAVAVATGVGAAAINTGPPQAPARPEPQGQGAGGGGQTTYVVNWNSPVVTAGTRAELGRDIRGMLSEAEAA